MDMRTIEKIEFGSALAVRAFLDAETARELSERFIAFDTETTGLDPDRDCIVELGAVLFEKGIPTASFQSYVNPGIPHHRRDAGSGTCRERCLSGIHEISG